MIELIDWSFRLKKKFKNLNSKCNLSDLKLRKKRKFKKNFYTINMSLYRFVCIFELFSKQNLKKKKLNIK